MCLTLGRTRAELLDQVDAVEWDWWHRVWKEMPFGPPVDDERLAILSARLYAAMGTAKSPADMRFEWGAGEREPVIIDSREGVKALVASLRG